MAEDKETDRVPHDTGKRTPYKYGGSLGWIASMIDPETSGWKPALPKQKQTSGDSREPDAKDESSA